MFPPFSVPDFSLLFTFIPSLRLRKSRFYLRFSAFFRHIRKCKKQKKRCNLNDYSVFAFFQLNFHTHEVDGSSPLVSTKKVLQSQRLRDFSFFSMLQEIPFSHNFLFYVI